MRILSRSFCFHHGMFPEDSAGRQADSRCCYRLVIEPYANHIPGRFDMCIPCARWLLAHHAERLPILCLVACSPDVAGQDTVLSWWRRIIFEFNPIKMVSKKNDITYNHDGDHNYSHCRSVICICSLAIGPVKPDHQDKQSLSHAINGRSNGTFTSHGPSDRPNIHIGVNLWQRYSRWESGCYWS